MMNFSNFNVITDDSDHYYASPRPKDCFSNSKSRVYKSVMKEWKILEKSLPESIYVRVYENRIDLMRAAIVGAAGTPYHDGLFFFDIKLPSDYPFNPPKVHYHSFGLELNPNLYGSGKVCLSLLNTWIGDKSEKWDPNGSTLLQVLLSIQALILNDDPFFNEPALGFLPQAMFLSKSRTYRERVFSLTCRSAVYLISDPPGNFKELVRAHFRERAVAILSACVEYVNGRVRVGYYGCCESSSGGGSSKNYNGSRSEVLIGMMERLYPDMVDKFLSCGADLDTSLEVLVVEEKSPKKKQMKNAQPKSKTNNGILGLEEEPPMQNQPKSIKTNGGIFHKAAAKIKKFFGWKNTSGKENIANHFD